METHQRDQEEKDKLHETARLAALLRGGKPPPPHKLGKRQLKALAAICDSFVGSTKDVPPEYSSDEAVARFFETSASMAGIPDQVAGVVSKEGLHPTLPLLRVALWFLSTWYGTLAICGPTSLSSSFPFLRSFSKLDSSRQEKLLLKLSTSRLKLRRELFSALQVVTVRLYYQTADEKNSNPSWKAIGYCGPDPNIPPLRQPLAPLQKAIIDLSSQEQLPALEGLHYMVNRDTSRLTLECDVVVVGSGSGGSVVAGVLAMAGYKVVVLEKGSYFPAGSLSLLEGPTGEQMYEKGGMLSSDDLSILFLAGATVGGGSSVNWSASFKTPDHVLQEWRDDHGLKLFGDEAYHKALEAVCDRMGVSPSTNAGTVAEGLNSAVLRHGCTELGIPVNIIPVNAPPGHDCGWCQFGCKDSKKKSTTQTWLADLAASGNSFILSGCDVVRITTSTQKNKKKKRVATGVIAKFKHGEITIKSRVTVAACGAINTPGLLRRSGLKNPNIGRNLHLHPVVMAWGYFPEDTRSSRAWLDPKKMSYTGELLTTMAPGQTSNVVIQTPSLHPGSFAALVPWTSSSNFKERMVRFSRTATIFALARDKGSGCSRYYPKSITYKLDCGDEAALQREVERMVKILAAAGAEEIGTHHRRGETLKVKGLTKEEIEEFAKRAGRRRIRGGETPICSAHQMGSCRMGREKKMSAVDEKGETWEVERLYVGDSSVFPTALGVNPMVTVQAIAFCTAQNILEVLREGSG